MLINSANTSSRAKILQEEYFKLINSGVDPSKILVLVQNSHKKKQFLEALKEKMPLGSIGNLKIYSFFGLCYNYILENWALIENSIKIDINRKISPNLCGLEVSQHIFKEAIKEVDFSGYNSKTSLLHQLLRRNSLINLNNLTNDEVDKRSYLLGESFGIQAKQAINKYKIKTIELRAFDYIRQMNLFEYLYKNTKNPFEYVFLDDGDEITPAIASYLDYIKPTVKAFFIGYDLDGSSRLGYLGAINIDFEKFLGEKAITDGQNDKIKQAKTILKSVREGNLIELQNIKTKTYLKRNEMIIDVLKDIKKLIIEGVKPSEISIITPNSDEFLKSSLEKSSYKFNFLTKNEKLNQNKLIGYILELLKIINDTNNSNISPYILKGIFIELLHFNPVETIKLIQQYKLERDFKNINLFDFIKQNCNSELVSKSQEIKTLKQVQSDSFLSKSDNFAKLLQLFEKIRFLKLSEQLYAIINTFIKIERDIAPDIIKLNQLLKQIVDFENVFGEKVKNFDLIIQLENTIISENPLSDNEIDENSIVVSSIQKIIDYSYQTKYQFLLDVSSENWLKQDIGPLYNAWVMQKKWNKESFELQDNIELTKDRTSRLLYKLFLLGDNLTLYSSVYDSLGLENFSGIDKYFKFSAIETKEEKSQNKIIPRPDQQEVLNYSGGLMSVSATAGSGKTTIMLLLVDKILSGAIIKGIEPKNIFVLTFMESAARNFRERIKANYPNLSELPSISTIHGLALRIIKENNNYSRLGLDFDFDIIDEIKRNALLSEIIISLNITPDKLDLYDKAISAYKNELALYPDFITSNRLFLNVSNSYEKKLKEQNLIDYDDLLLYSLKLLRENSDVLSYYQDLVHIIIEDEAQDSSFVQQNLIRLLGGKYNNIIRCGDINQAITSTFTNSDVKGFKEFINNSKNVEMDRCQRCATGVLDCANNTVKYANSHNVDAFSKLIMKPVENKNIVDKFAVTTSIFNEEQEETTFILDKIRSIYKKDKDASIAILLRSNFAIEKWDKLLNDNLIKTYKNSDSLINNSVYRLTLYILEYIINPFDLDLIKKIALELYEIGYFKYESYKYAQNLDKALFLKEDFDEPLFWDLTHFLFKNHYSIYDLVVEIGENYFYNSKEIENVPLVAAIAQKISNQSQSFEQTVEKMRTIQYKTNFSNIKFYTSEDKSKTASKVQIMTLHKSKGDEFDYVFIPELTQDNLCLNVNELKLKENSKFIQKVKYEPKTDDILKKEIVEENYRLIYVGITRAKKKLYLTSAQKYKYYAKVKDYKPTELLEGLEELAYEKN